MFFLFFVIPMVSSDIYVDNVKIECNWECYYLLHLAFHIRLVSLILSFSSSDQIRSVFVTKVVSLSNRQNINENVLFVCHRYYFNRRLSNFFTHTYTLKRKKKEENFIKFNELFRVICNLHVYIPLSLYIVKLWTNKLNYMHCSVISESHYFKDK